ncbi:cytochrome c3 family protein [Candidatus Hydrogenedentota bacterium]
MSRDRNHGESSQGPGCFARLKLAIVTLVVFVALFSGGAYVVTDLSGFCTLCHPQHGELWANSTHQDITCVKCHVDPGVKGAVEAKIRGVRNVFVAIKQGNEVYRGEEPLLISSENCRGCHAGILYLNELGYDDLPDNSLKASGLIMGHRIHVEKHKIDCVWCHRNVVHRDPTEIGKYAVNWPMMHEDCVVCHHGERIVKYDVTLPDLEDAEKCVMCHPTNVAQAEAY